MKRVSYYINAEAAAALDVAVNQVRKNLGKEVPKHVVLSALIQEAADSAGPVATRLAQERAQALAEQLERLQQENPEG
jgi:hypothetical protein